MLSCFIIVLIINLDIMKNKEERGNKKKKVNSIFDLVGLTSIVGINFKKAAELHIALRINNMEDLYNACKENKLAQLSGWGTVSQSKIKSQIELNVLWMMGQCNKAKEEVSSPYQAPLSDKETLLKMASEFNVENL